MVKYKGEYFINGVDDKKRPDIVIQISMKVKSQREQWSEQKRLDAKVWLIEQRDRLNDFISDL